MSVNRTGKMSRIRRVEMVDRGSALHAAQGPRRSRTIKQSNSRQAAPRGSPGKRRRKTGDRAGVPTSEHVFRQFRSGPATPDSLHLVVGVLEVASGRRDEIALTAGRGGSWRQNRGGGASVLKWRNEATRQTVAAALAAVGQAHRLTILETLLDGPAVYRTLQKVTKLKAGPLYHHIHQLRLASLILPKQRDLYELTRAGRNLALIALGLDRFIQDTRRRPIGLAIDEG